MNSELNTFSENAVNKINKTVRRYEGKSFHDSKTVFINTTDYLIGEIIAAPEGQSEYTDHRYWWRRARITNSDTDRTAALTFGEETIFSCTGTATNLNEIVAETHNLSVGTIVLIRSVCDYSGVVRWEFAG
jgi:hypothetical protein